MSVCPSLLFPARDGRGEAEVVARLNAVGARGFSSTVGRADAGQSELTDTCLTEHHNFTNQ